MAACEVVVQISFLEENTYIAQVSRIKFCLVLNFGTLHLGFEQFSFSLIKCTLPHALCVRLTFSRRLTPFHCSLLYAIVHVAIHVGPTSADTSVAIAFSSTTFFTIALRRRAVGLPASTPQQKHAQGPRTSFHRAAPCMRAVRGSQCRKLPSSSGAHQPSRPKITASTAACPDYGARYQCREYHAGITAQSLAGHAESILRQK